MKQSNYSTADFNRVCDFLRKMYKINQNEFCWLPARWEYAAFYCSSLYMSRGYPNWEKTIRIWEENDEIVGIVSSEYPDWNAYLQVHPNHRHIEDELISWAEENIALPNGIDNRRKIYVTAIESDSFRKDLLAKRGYVPAKDLCYHHHYDLKNGILPVKLPDGFKIISAKDNLNALSRAECLTKAFGHSNPIRESDLKHYRLMQKGPIYRSDLDIGIVDENGNVCACCTIWLDEELDLGVFEPVGTHPEYQKKGFAKAMLHEGLNKLHKLGIRWGNVQGFGDSRSAFYKSCGFIANNADRGWLKEW